jgi:hypothetical protein
MPPVLVKASLSSRKEKNIGIKEETKNGKGLGNARKKPQTKKLRWKYIL